MTIFSKLYPRDSDKNCLADIYATIFDDFATKSILDNDVVNPYNGRFRPSTPIATSLPLGLPMNGTWRLELYDYDIDQINGSLEEWKLHFDLEPCIQTYHWTKINSKGELWPSPRHSHSTAVVGNSFFLMGGFNDRYLDDLWRYDHDTGKWNILRPSNVIENTADKGISAFIGPRGIYSVGGLFPLRYKDSIQYKIISTHSKTVKKPLLNESSSIHPLPRYHSTVCPIGLLRDRRHAPAMLLGKNYQPAFIMFGGDEQWNPHEHYLNDLWAVHIDSFATHNSDINSDETICEEILDPSYSRWNESCYHFSNNDNDVSDCTWSDILTMAWCRGEYQSLSNPTY